MFPTARVFRVTGMFDIGTLDARKNLIHSSAFQGLDLVENVHLETKQSSTQWMRYQHLRDSAAISNESKRDCPEVGKAEPEVSPRHRTSKEASGIIGYTVPSIQRRQ